MKYLTIIALFASVSAIKKTTNAPFACEYHKSEDGTECITINNPCTETWDRPVLEKCPARTRASDRSATPPPPPKEEQDPNPTPGTAKPDATGATPAASLAQKK